jgi:type VI secretion system protein ImpA
MASEQIIPLDQLLEPISADSAVGIDIRDNPSPTSPYYSIKDARNAARAAERNNIFDNDNTEADNHWRKILELAPDILLSQSKDLEIASWYVEALVRRFGFQGLRDGFKLIYGLIENFWNDLYPLPDEDGIETRVAPLTGLNGEGAEGVLIAPIRNIYITQGSSCGPYNYWMYQQALDVEKILDEETKREKASKLGFSNEDVERAVSESSEQFYIDLVEDTDQAIETFREISRILDEYCGINDSPPTSNIINILVDCLGAIKHIGKDKFPEINEEGSEDAPDNETDSTAGQQVQAQQSTKGIQSRADAFKKLIEISDFFRKTEPHSPIPYILERAVRWGDMPLDELIRELIPDSSARDTYGSLTGIRTEEDED